MCAFGKSTKWQSIQPPVSEIDPDPELAELIDVSPRDHDTDRDSPVFWVDSVMLFTCADRAAEFAKVVECQIGGRVSVVRGRSSDLGDVCFALARTGAEAPVGYLGLSHAPKARVRG